MSIKIHDTYQFYYSHPILGNTRFYPANSSLEFAWKKEKGQVFYRLDLNTSLNIVGDEFKKFYALDRGQYRGEKIGLEIKRKCGDSYNPFWTGFFALIDGNFDVSRCKLEIKPRIDDVYTPFIEDWEKEKDFIGGEGAPKAYTLSLIEGSFEYTDCTTTLRIEDSDPPPAPSMFSNCVPNDYPATWQFVKYEIEKRGIPGEEESVWSKKYFYSRIITTTQCDGGNPVMPFGDGWIMISNNCPNSTTWARPINLSNNLDLTKLNNGRKLKDVLQYATNLLVTSNFFSINNDNSNPNNAAYEYALKYLNDLHIYQKSDVRRLSPKAADDTDLVYQNATKAIYKLKDLLDSLRTIFNVFWYIDNSKLIIEHISYFQNNYMLDMTKESLKHRIRGFHKYQYKKEELPITEKFKWMEDSDIDGDFDAPSIKYNKVFSYDKEDGKNTEYSTKSITTNIEFISLNKDKISDAGFVIAAVKNGSIIASKGVISGTYKINAPLCFANLLDALHRHDRPQINGNMNNSDTRFETARKIRKQDPISIEICCTDLSEFDPKDLVKTQLGWGEVETATFKDPASLLTLNLTHV